MQCLQVVTFLHTVLLSKNLKFRTALVVCPLNTVLNWVNEFKKWQSNMGQDKVRVCKAIKICETKTKQRKLVVCNTQISHVAGFRNGDGEATS